MPPPKPPPPTVAEEVSQAFPTNGEAFGRMDVPRFELSLPLPDRNGWVTTETERSSFLVLDHAATRSRLVVRVWRESDVMTPVECEQRARSLRELPPRDDGVEPSAVEAPRGFDTRVDVGVLATRPGEPLRGHLTAFGAEAHRCLAFAFTTEAIGPEAERRIADRLAVIEGVTLGQMRLVHDLP
jgi:hypothetical protein